MEKEKQPEMAERKHAGDPGRFLARPISLASYPVASPLPGPRARVRVIEEVNAGGINAGHQPAVAIVRPAAAAPPRRPDPVEQRRAAETNKIGRASCRERAHTREYGERETARNGGEKARRRPRPLFGATHLVGELPRSKPTAWPSRARKGDRRG